MDFATIPLNALTLMNQGLSENYGFGNKSEIT